MNKYMVGPEESLGDIRWEKNWMDRADKRIYDCTVTRLRRCRDGVAVRGWPLVDPGYGHSKNVLNDTYGSIDADLKAL